jgi:hypothetical protein
MRVSKHRLYEGDCVWATRPQRGVPRRRRSWLRRAVGPAVSALTLAVLLLAGDYR